MTRILSLAILFFMSFIMVGHSQSNPFDLKYRPAQPGQPKSDVFKDTAQAPIQKPITAPTSPPVEQDKVGEIAASSLPVKDTVLANPSSNPFDLKKGSKDVNEKPQEKAEEKDKDKGRTTSDIQYHNNPTVNPQASGPIRMGRGIQIFCILLSLLFLIFIVNVERNFVKDLWRVISNENYSSLHLRNQRNTMRQILMIMGYIIFLIQAGIFLCHLLSVFGYSGSYLTGIWACIGFVALVYAVRHIVIRYLRWLFNNEKEMSLFGFDISTFNIMVGLVLLPVNVLLNFGPETMAKPLIIIGIIVISGAYLMRQLRWMLTARRLIVNSLFLFFVYLCAVEILPLWAILKFFW